MLRNFLASIGSYVGEFAGVAGALLEHGYAVLDLVSTASYVNGFVSAGGVTSDTQNSPVTVAASVGVLSQSTSNVSTSTDSARLLRAQ